jgi:hypothetical protein
MLPWTPACEEARGRNFHIDRHCLDILSILDCHPRTPNRAGANANHINSSKVYNRGVGIEHSIIL